MKKITLLLAFIAIVLTSCKTEFMQYVNYYDFEKITRSTGIELTSSPSVAYDYLGLGEIVIAEKSGNITYKTIDFAKGDAIYGTPGVKNNYGEYIDATPDHALTVAAQIAKSKGATAIINLKFEEAYENGRIVGVTIKGMIIRKK